MSPLAAYWSYFEHSPYLRMVAAVVVVLAVLSLLFCITLVVHHSFTSARRSRRTAAVRDAAPFLAPHIAAGDGLREAVAESRRRFGPWATAIVLREARGEMRGNRLAELTQALDDLGELTRLQRAAGSRQSWRRVTAMRELGQAGGEQALGLLLAGTRDQSPEVRRVAREGLLTNGSPDAVKTAIRSYLEDAPTGTAWRRSFYARLAKVGSDQLRELLDGHQLDGAEEKLALEALGDARVTGALPLARARLAHDDAEIRASAARVVGKLEDAASIPTLTTLLADPSWFVRASAAKAFESIRAAAPVRQALGHALGDEAWWVRCNAAHALTRQGEEGVDILLDTLEGEGPDRADATAGDEQSTRRVSDVYARDAAMAALGMSPLVPGARRRLERILARLQDDPQTEPLRRLLAAVPEGGRL